jgi:hypothetical protein
MGRVKRGQYKEAVGKEFHPCASQIWRRPAHDTSTFCLVRTILPILLYYLNRDLVRKEVD